MPPSRQCPSSSASPSTLLGVPYTSVRLPLPSPYTCPPPTPQLQCMEVQARCWWYPTADGVATVTVTTAASVPCRSGAQGACVHVLQCQRGRVLLPPGTATWLLPGLPCWLGPAACCRCASRAIRCGSSRRVAGMMVPLSGGSTGGSDSGRLCTGPCCWPCCGLPVSAGGVAAGAAAACAGEPAGCDAAGAAAAAQASPLLRAVTAIRPASWPAADN